MKRRRERRKKILLRKGRGDRRPGVATALARVNGRSRGLAAPEPDFLGAWDYAPAPESTSHLTIRPRYDLFIGGKWVAPKSKKYFDSINPATRKTASNQAEYDFTADYRPPWRWPPFLQGMWFRARADILDQQNAKTLGYQFRLSLNWERDLL